MNVFNSTIYQLTNVKGSLLLYGNLTGASPVISSVSCSYPNKNITIKIDESSSNPHYLAFVLWFQQGRRDITAVQLCEVLYASLSYDK